MGARREHYNTNGYCIVEGLVSSREIETLKEETVAIFRGKYPVEGIKPLSREAPETECLQEYLCIHHPHKISRVMLDFVSHPGIVDVLTELIGANVKCMQSMLFVKPPGFPGQAWHQDEYYIPTEDRSLTGAWIAIDDATVDNGCLWVIPESHRMSLLPVGPQPPSEDYDGIGNISLGVPANEAIPCKMNSGSVVFFNGFLLHESRKNRSQTYRRSLVNHYMSAESQLFWGKKEDCRDIVLVAGSDPYSSRGLANIHQPGLRSRT